MYTVVSTDYACFLCYVSMFVFSISVLCILVFLCLSVLSIAIWSVDDKVVTTLSW